MDPYTVQASEFRRDRMPWPEVSYLDVYTYLVCSTSWYSKTQMKAFKSLDAYKLSQEDWIQEMLHKEINGFHLLRAKVTHSYAVNNTPLEPWVIISKDGAVESAHCTCMAGLAEACTHIAAVLFCLETCARVRSETSPTDLPAYWIFPTTARLDTQFKKLKDIDFQSAAKKRKQKSTLDADRGDEPRKCSAWCVQSELLNLYSSASVCTDHILTVIILLHGRCDTGSKMFHLLSRRCDTGANVFSLSHLLCGVCDTDYKCV